MSTTFSLQPLYDLRAKLQRELEALDFVIGRYESGERVLETFPIETSSVNLNRHTPEDYQALVLETLTAGPLSTPELWHALRTQFPRLEYPTLAHHLKRMEKEGVIQGEIQVTDRRRRVYTRVNFLAKAI